GGFFIFVPSPFATGAAPTHHDRRLCYARWRAIAHGGFFIFVPSPFATGAAPTHHDRRLCYARWRAI
ncbi:hypothetical protein C7E12_23605, partial [Stenotrophomonas maltophilia]